METDHLASKDAGVKQAEKYLVSWRYIRWLQMAIGLFVMGWGFYGQLAYPFYDAPLILGIVHPWVLFMLGLAAVTEAFWEKRARDKRLIVALARNHGTTVN